MKMRERDGERREERRESKNRWCNLAVYLINFSRTVVGWKRIVDWQIEGLRKRPGVPSWRLGEMALSLKSRERERIRCSIVSPSHLPR